MTTPPFLKQPEDHPMVYERTRAEQPRPPTPDDELILSPEGEAAIAHIVERILRSRKPPEHHIHLPIGREAWKAHVAGTVSGLGSLFSLYMTGGLENMAGNPDFANAWMAVGVGILGWGATWLKGNAAPPPKEMVRP